MALWHRHWKAHCAAAAGALLLSSFAVTAAEDTKDASQSQPAPKHHSKAKGAVVGGVGGAVVGGKKGAAVGAAGGALVQHHKNKKAEKAAKKGQ
jgi:osmotically inducible lipoprotein OsmB